MQSKCYTVREREKLISPIFKTTFTISGGPDLAYKFWQGDNSLKGNHIVNQPCIRHWDIELTGDKKHLSFFNMFVADSIDGYSRLEIVGHFFEFFTKQLKMDFTKFYASYFGGGLIKDKQFDPDFEMKNIWLKIGIKPENIFSSTIENPMENFVANTVEPVGGPRAELFYDVRKDNLPVKSVEEFWQLESQGHLLEFFTHVLYGEEIKIDEKENFIFKSMDNKAIAAGFGPQRLLRIFEHVDSIGDITIFDSLKKCFGNISPEYHKETVIVCDHIRGLIFLINDGILDLSNKSHRSHKYLFRKYFTNFKNNFRKLSLDNEKQVLSDLTNKAIDLFSVLFPYFEDKRNYIVDKIEYLYYKD